MRNKISKIGQIIKASLKGKKYEIKLGYIHRKHVPHFDDTSNEDEYQKEVYDEVKKWMMEKNLSSICDIGCGSAFKLINYLGDYDITGVEVEPTLSFLKTKYPNNQWKNLEEIKNQSFDIVILADVIEHIENPTEFLNLINSTIKFKYIFISTPERDLHYGYTYHYGPPRNPHHIREWNQKEFNKYCSRFYTILEHKVYIEKHKTQLVIGGR